VLIKKIAYIIIVIVVAFPCLGKQGWYSQDSETEEFLYGACFVDSLTGWVAGDHGLILHTTDGGESWSVQEANVGSWLLSVYFIDKLNGWAVGDVGAVRHTSDGGKTWEYQKTNYPVWLNTVFFVNNDKGWAAGSEGIITTDDGGETWNAVESATITTPKSIYFVSETAGWVCGANGMIIRTFDGGESWEELNTGNSGTIYDVFFLDLSSGWAVARHEPKLLRTTNGGLDWLPQEDEIGGFFKSIDFIDRDYGWAAGPGGIINTTDGGKTWDVQVPDSRYNLWWIDVISRRKGWAVGGDGAVLKTDNGGIKFVVDFEANVVSGEAPLSTTFTDLSEGEHNQWHWDFGDGGTHTVKNPVNIYTEPGYYSVTLRISDGLDSESKTKYNYIHVTGEDELIADFEADSTKGSKPFTVSFTDLSLGNPDEWAWDFGDGGTHKSQNPVHVYQESGTYSVELTVRRDSEHDSEIKTDYIQVNEPISVGDDFTEVFLDIGFVEPNPVVDEANIFYEVFGDGILSVEVFDFMGNVVYDFPAKHVVRGKYFFKWNMRDEFFNSVAPGVYFVRFSFEIGGRYYFPVVSFIYIK
jgi:PKD repeat protein